MQPKYTQLRLDEKPIRVSRVECICTVCGRAFLVQPARLKHGRGKTCSRECQYKSVRAKAIARPHPTHVAPRVQIVCATCGNTFEMTEAQYRRRCERGKVPTYCSVRCAHDAPAWKRHIGDALRTSEHAIATRDRAIRAAHAASQTPEGIARRRQQTLEQMRDPEKRKAWEEGMRRRTASPEWRSAPHFQRGTAHPRYTGYRDERTADRVRYETKVWRRAVFRRDGYTCQVCGTRGGHLNAHHIKPWAQFPDLRHDVANGITLCESCHKAVHRGEVTLERHDHTPGT